MRGKQLNSDDVIAARLDEIKHLHPYEVCEKDPIGQCWALTGRVPVKIKWVNINKGDKVKRDYRSRLVAKELKLDKRLDLFRRYSPTWG